MTIKCPHCNSEYDIDNSEFGKFVKCEMCRRSFVVGQVAERKSKENRSKQGIWFSGANISVRLLLVLLAKIFLCLFCGIMTLCGVFCFLKGFGLGGYYYYNDSSLGEIAQSLQTIKSMVFFALGYYSLRALRSKK